MVHQDASPALIGKGARNRTEAARFWRPACYPVNTTPIQLVPLHGLEPRSPGYKAGALPDELKRRELVRKSEAPVISVLFIYRNNNFCTVFLIVAKKLYQAFHSSLNCIHCSQHARIKIFIRLRMRNDCYSNNCRRRNWKKNHHDHKLGKKNFAESFHFHHPYYVLIDII